MFELKAIHFPPTCLFHSSFFLKQKFQCIIPAFLKFSLQESFFMLLSILTHQICSQEELCCLQWHATLSFLHSKNTSLAPCCVPKLKRTLAVWAALCPQPLHSAERSDDVSIEDAGRVGSLPDRALEDSYTAFIPAAIHQVEAIVTLSRWSNWGPHKVTQPGNGNVGLCVKDPCSFHLAFSS